MNHLLFEIKTSRSVLFVRKVFHFNETYVLRGGPFFSVSSNVMFHECVPVYMCIGSDQCDVISLNSRDLR